MHVLSLPHCYNNIILMYLSSGHGVITTNNVSLSSSSSFLTDPPTFTLFGDTSGGPPTTYIWIRNGQIISNSASYSISIQVNEDISARFRESHYRSRLTVTGRLPGLYAYTVVNRATSTRNNVITIEGKVKCISM